MLTAGVGGTAQPQVWVVQLWVVQRFLRLLPAMFPGRWMGRSDMGQQLVGPQVS